MHHTRKLLSLLMALALVVSLVPAALAAEEEETHVTILATSDLHGSIWGYSYEDLKETDNNGMARLYTYIQQVREENPNTFLIDGGDDIEGTIMVNQIYNKIPDEFHPVIAAMNYMGYDTMTLGNHEFNYGIPNMLKIVGRAEFPVLAANILDADGEYITGEGWAIVEKGGVKLAVIGVTSPNVPNWDGGKEGIDECTYEPVSDGVKRAIAEIGELEEQPDIIMVSSHTGLGAEYDEEGGADSAQKILDENPEVDVLQVAHTHTTVSEKQGDVPIGGVRNAAVEIARFDLTLDKDGNITDSAVTIVSMADYEPSQEIRDIPEVAEAHQKTLDLITGEVVGSTTAKFQPENEIRGIPAGKLQDTAVMDLINKIQLEASGADVSAAAIFSDASDLPEGDLYYSDIFGIYKFDNTLYRVTVTGAELKAYMEWSAQHYNTWQPGDINISFNPEVPGYRYDMFAGVDYEIDLSEPVGQRIKNVMFKGEPLADDQELTLAVNNYRYSSGLKANNLIAGTLEWESAEPIRDMIANYLAENSPITPECDNNWKIVGVDLQLDNPERAEIIEKINNGEIDTPYNKSYNINPIEGNVVIDNKGGDVATVTDADGVTYYRLREVASLLAGTKAAFDVTWTSETGVTIVKGTDYTAGISPVAEGEAVAGTATITVDGEAVEVAVMNLGNSNYVSSEGLLVLLDLSAAVESDGILTLTASVNSGVGG